MQPSDDCENTEDVGINVNVTNDVVITNDNCDANFVECECECKDIPKRSAADKEKDILHTNIHVDKEQESRMHKDILLEQIHQ